MSLEERVDNGCAAMVKRLQSVYDCKGSAAAINWESAIASLACFRISNLKTPEVPVLSKMMQHTESLHSPIFGSENRYRLLVCMGGYGQDAHDGGQDAHDG
jgi:hypothetical protein